MTQRKSLTKAQLQGEQAIELLALLQTITEDGQLLDEEISALQHWLREHEASELPGAEYLRECVSAVLEDGRVTDEERRWLHAAAEKVLPPDERSFAATRRKEAKSAARDLARAEDQVQKEEQRRITELSMPIAKFDFMVAGARYEGRPATIRQHCRVEEEAFLVRDQGNRYSSHAILIRLGNGLDVGYVPEFEAKRLAPLLDAGARQAAEVKKILSGGESPVPVVWGELYAADAPVEDAKTSSDLPAQAKRSGCLGAIVLLTGATLATLVAVFL